MRQLSNLPDGSPSTRSVSLEPRVDAAVYAHMQSYGFTSISAALRDLVDRGLATVGEPTDQRARAYREAMKKVEREVAGVVHGAVAEWARGQGVSAPAARAVDRTMPRAVPRKR